MEIFQYSKCIIWYAGTLYVNIGKYCYNLYCTVGDHGSRIMGSIG